MTLITSTFSMISPWKLYSLTFFTERKKKREKIWTIFSLSLSYAFLSLTHSFLRVLHIIRRRRRKKIMGREKKRIFLCMWTHCIVVCFLKHINFFLPVYTLLLYFLFGAKNTSRKIKKGKKEGKRLQVFFLFLFLSYEKKVMLMFDSSELKGTLIIIIIDINFHICIIWLIITK